MRKEIEGKNVDNIFILQNGLEGWWELCLFQNKTLQSGDKLNPIWLLENTDSTDDELPLPSQNFSTFPIYF